MLYTYIKYITLIYIKIMSYRKINTYLYRGKSPITDPLLIPTPFRISVTIRDIKK